MFKCCYRFQTYYCLKLSDGISYLDLVKSLSLIGKTQNHFVIASICDLHILPHSKLIGFQTVCLASLGIIIFLRHMAIFSSVDFETATDMRI